MSEGNEVSDPVHKDPVASGEMQFLESEGGQGQWRYTVRSPSFRPPTDVFETEQDLIVRVEIAGMQDRDIDIELDNRVLSIHGVRPDIAARRAYHQMEIRFGEFTVELELPVPILADQVQAVYENGFLMITMPKERPLHIHVETEE
jgi:HSP20 family protein